MSENLRGGFFLTHTVCDKFVVVILGLVVPALQYMHAWSAIVVQFFEK